MDVTRDVILDLLPLYLADEASADTRALVEAYLETDPGLARIAAEDRTSAELPQDIPIPLTEADKMVSYRRAKQLWLLGSVVLAVVISAAVGLAVLAFFMLSARMPVP